MRQSTPARRAVLVLAALALLFFATSFMSAQKACSASGGSGGVEINYQYFPDATYTNGCGYKVIACNGSTFVWGCQTAYYTVTYIDC